MSYKEITYKVISEVDKTLKDDIRISLDKTTRLLGISRKTVYRNKQRYAAKVKANNNRGDLDCGVKEVITQLLKKTIKGSD